MRIGMLQHAPVFGEKEANLHRIGQAMEQNDADLWVFPELATTGYQFIESEELTRMAEELPGGETLDYLGSICRKKNTSIVIGLAERSKEGFYNSAALIGPHGFMDRYRKVHLFDSEKRWFLPGGDPFRVFDIGFAKIGMMICFDWIYPEAARSLALQGAEILCHPSNLVLPFCQNAMVTRVLENRVFAFTANRIGREARDPENPLRFTGGSQAVGPDGSILFRMGEEEEGVKIVEIDPSMARRKNITENNDLWEDRRPDLYKPG